MSAPAGCSSRPHRAPARLDPLLGAYLAGVYGGGKAPGDRVFLPVERSIYRIVRRRPEREQRGPSTRCSLLAFSLVSVLVLYLLQRVQGSLPLNPTDATACRRRSRSTPRSSFVTNTNWQNYGGEPTMSHLTQMAGLAVQNFVSAAVGIAVAVALIRGLVRRRSATIGNFWVDLTRGTIRVLLPLAFVVALVLVSQGVVQNFHGFTEATTVQGATQSIPGGPIASQEAIKELGTNGGGLLQRQLGAPVREPERLHQPARDLRPPDDPVRAHLHVRPAGQGPAPGLGALRGDVRALDRRRRPRDALRGRRATRRLAGDRRRRRQHGGQGGPLRHRGVRPVRRVDDRHVDRLGQLGPRQLHAARRRGAAREHDARRGQPRRRRRRPLRDARLRAARRVHRRARWSGARPSTSARRSRPRR